MKRRRELEMEGRRVEDPSENSPTAGLVDVVFILCKHFHNPFWVIGVVGVG